MMDERTQSFRAKSNNDNIQIDVREHFRNAIALSPTPLTLCKQTWKNWSLSISIIEISITDMFFGSHLSCGVPRRRCSRVSQSSHRIMASPSWRLTRSAILEWIDRRESPRLYILKAIRNLQINTHMHASTGCVASRHLAHHSAASIKLKSHLLPHRHYHFVWCSKKV